MANVKKQIIQIAADAIGTSATDITLYTVEEEQETLLSMKVDLYFWTTGTTGGPHTASVKFQLGPSGTLIVARSAGDQTIDDRDAYYTLANYVFGATPGSHPCHRSILQDVQVKRIMYRDDTLFLSHICDTGAQIAVVGSITLFILEK